jgi:hypothetical protein
MEKINRGEWQYQGEKIRFRSFSYYDWDGEYLTDYEFEIFKKPYFFGLLGKRRWLWAISTNSISMGLGFSKHLVTGASG